MSSFSLPARAALPYPRNWTLRREQLETMKSGVSSGFSASLAQTKESIGPDQNATIHPSASTKIL